VVLRTLAWTVGSRLLVEEILASRESNTTTISGGMTKAGMTGIPETADDRLPEVAIHPRVPVHQGPLITELDVTHALQIHSAL
jgi:hypothetical protein